MTWISQYFDERTDSKLSRKDHTPLPHYRANSMFCLRKPKSRTLSHTYDYKIRFLNSTSVLKRCSDHVQSIGTFSESVHDEKRPLDYFVPPSLQLFDGATYVRVISVVFVWLTTSATTRFEMLTINYNRASRYGNGFFLFHSQNTILNTVVA